jgi:NIPSNAP
MLYELRRYEIRAGRRAEWVAFMESTIIPFQVAKGIVVAGSFISETEPDVFIWLRRFDDETARQRLYAAVYEDPKWIQDIKPFIDEILNRETVQVTRLIPTALSVLC